MGKARGAVRGAVRGVEPRTAACVFAICALAVLAVALSPGQAHAYGYARTDTGTVYNRCYIDAWNDDSGYLALMGADPHAPRAWAPSFDGPSGWSGYVRSFWFQLQGANGVRDDLYAWNGSWEVAGARFGHGVIDLADGWANGTGFGCLATYGYRWEGGGEIARLGGYDARMTARTYIDDSVFGTNRYAEVEFWPRVKIRYDAQGGTNAPASQWKYIGSVLNIASGAPRRTGYTFEGWALEPGGPVRIASGQRVGYEDWNLARRVIASHDWDNGPSAFFEDDGGGQPSPTGTNTITLYAVWKPISYTVEYRGNGATSGTMASTKHVYDAPRRLAPNGFKRSYRLTCDAQGGAMGTKRLTCTWPWASWNTDPAGLGRSFADGASVQNLRSSPGTLALYAQWKPGTVRLPDPGVRPHSEFLGWFTRPVGGERLGGTGDTVSIAKDTTCYAQWKELSTVEYLVDGERTPVFSETVPAGTAYRVSGTARERGEKPKCAGLDGWYTDEACTQRYEDGTPAPAGVLRLYARNAVELRYELADASVQLIEGRACWMDEEHGQPASAGLMLPRSQILHWGDRVTFASGPGVWFEDRGGMREASCVSGAYATPDAEGTPARTVKLTQNTVAYLLWRIPLYEGIELS